MFSDIYELLPKLPKKVDEQEKKLLNDLFGDECEKEFKNIITSLYDNVFSFDLVKTISTTTGFNTNLNIVKAYEYIRHIYDNLPKDEQYNNIKVYLFTLLFEPVEHMRRLMKKIHETHIKDLNDTVKDFLNTLPLKLAKGRTPCLLSMICINSTESIHELFTPEFTEATFSINLPDIDENGVDYFDNVFKSVYLSHKEEERLPAQGGETFNKRLSTITASNNIMKISKYYNRIQEINDKRTAEDNKFLKSFVNRVNNSFLKPIKYNISDFRNKDILSCYLGEYNKVNNFITDSDASKIPNTSFNYNMINKNLVLNQEAFKNCDKKKVAIFLARYKPVFNEICINSIDAINDTLKHNTSKFNDIDTSITGSIKSHYNDVIDSFNSLPKTATIKDRLNWACGSYANIINKLRSVINNDIDLAEARNTIMKGGDSKNDGNILIGGNSYNLNILSLPPSTLTKVSSSLKGGNKETKEEDKQDDKEKDLTPVEPTVKTEYIYKPVETIRYITQYKQVGGDSNDSLTNTAKYIKNLMDAQSKFNNKFEEIYKNLIKSFTTIQTDNAKEQNSKLFDCVYSLMSIKIDSPKTTVYLSGFYAAKNWNRHFVESCKKVISNLETNGNGLFNAVISIIKQLINLCEDSNKESIKYKNEYMTISKETSEIISTINKVVKIPCKLTQDELNSYAENLKKLMAVFTSISNETTSYSLKQQMTNFIKNVKSRTDLIKEYFRNKNERAKIGGSNIFNQGRIEMITQLNNQMMNCLIYLNEVVDIKLAEYRETVADKKMFDNKVFDKFEKAMIQFKDISNNQDLLKTIEKIKEAIYNKEDNKDNKHEKSMFSLIKSIQRFWKQSGYIDFVIQLYTEFNIFSDGFNWSQFRDNMSLLLSLVNVSVSTTYKCDVVDSNNDDVYNEVIDITDIKSINTIAENIVATGVGGINSQDIQTIILALQQMLTYSYNNNDLSIETTNLPSDGTKKLKIKLSDKHFKFTLSTTEEANESGELSLANMVFDSMLVNVLDVINRYTQVKYTGNFNLPLQISTLIKGGNKDGNKEDVNYGIEIEDDNNNKYEGGNIYDVLSVNDNNFDKVISEAVPFYLSAFNILIFYYNRYGPGRQTEQTENKPTLFFNIPKISPLYPISSKLETYSINNTSSLNIQLIKCGVGVFNVYWNKAQGDASAKLSGAIDMILNEINACMIYTTKLQYESMKITGKLSNNFLSSLQSNLNSLTQSLSESMTESIINISMNNEQQAIVYENILKRSYEKVKNAPESEKLNALMSVLTSTNKNNDNATQLYKFIDLALMPLISTCMAYSNIFSLFNILESETDTKIKEYDLSKVVITTPLTMDGQLKTITVWEAIEYVRNNYYSNDDEKQINAVVVKNILEASTVVDDYNTFVLSNTVYDIIYNNSSYTTPADLWYPLFVESYPKRPVITSKAINGAKITDDIKLTLYQLYPYTNGNNLYDYFTTALSEFAADIDHCIHLLLSFPEIHDKFIKKVSKTIHKYVDNKLSFVERFGITERQREIMTAINMESKLSYTRPPAYKGGYFIPQYNDTKTLLPSVSVYNAGEFVPNSNISALSYIPVDGYNQNIILFNSSQRDNLIASYSWTDWVVQKLANCDVSFNCLPWKLLTLLQQQSILSRRLQPLAFESYQNVDKIPQPYAITQTGLMVNPITSNIITRSLTQSNQDKSRDNGLINKQWVSNLIALIPYMVNKLKVNASHIGSEASYDGIQAKNELITLSNCLITFYNDLVSSTPKIGFMENNTLFENNTNYHAIAEIIPYIIKYNIENISSSDYSKYEWANKYFFSNISELSFPEYQNFDRFGKIKAFAVNVFSNGVFANEFDTVKSILAKNIWSASVISSKINELNNKPESTMFDYIMKAINISSELVPAIAERFVNNCLTILRNSDKFDKGQKILDDNNNIVNLKEYTSNTVGDIFNFLNITVPKLTNQTIPIMKKDIDYIENKASELSRQVKSNITFTNNVDNVISELSRRGIFKLLDGIADNETFNIPNFINTNIRNDMKQGNYLRLIYTRNNADDINNGYLSNITGDNLKRLFDEYAKSSTIEFGTSGGNDIINYNLLNNNGLERILIPNADIYRLILNNKPIDQATRQAYNPTLPDKVKDFTDKLKVNLDPKNNADILGALINSLGNYITDEMAANKMITLIYDSTKQFRLGNNQANVENSLRTNALYIGRLLYIYIKGNEVQKKIIERFIMSIIYGLFVIIFESTDAGKTLIENYLSTVLRGNINYNVVINNTTPDDDVNRIYNDGDNNTNMFVILGTILISKFYNKDALNTLLNNNIFNIANNGVYQLQDITKDNLNQSLTDGIIKNYNNKVEKLKDNNIDGNRRNLLGAEQLNDLIIINDVNNMVGGSLFKSNLQLNKLKGGLTNTILINPFLYTVFKDRETENVSLTIIDLIYSLYVLIHFITYVIPNKENNNNLDIAVKGEPITINRKQYKLYSTTREPTFNNIDSDKVLWTLNSIYRSNNNVIDEYVSTLVKAFFILNNDELYEKAINNYCYLIESNENFSEYVKRMLNDLRKRIKNNFGVIYNVLTIKYNMLEGNIVNNADNTQLYNTSSTINNNNRDIDFYTALRNYFKLINKSFTLTAAYIISGCPYVMGRYNYIYKQTNAALNKTLSDNNKDVIFSRFNKFDGLISILKVYQGSNKIGNLSGGYNINDVNKYITILLNSLIDLNKLPINTINRITEPFNYEEAIIMAGKLLNLIPEYKVFPDINKNVIQCNFDYDNNINLPIYKVLMNKSNTENGLINTIFNDLYKFETQPYNKLNKNNDIVSDYTIFAKIWNNIKDKKLIKQLKLIFDIEYCLTTDANNKITLDINKVEEHYNIRRLHFEMIGDILKSFFTTINNEKDFPVNDPGDKEDGIANDLGNQLGKIKDVWNYGLKLIDDEIVIPNNSVAKMNCLYLGLLYHFGSEKIIFDITKLKNLNGDSKYLAGEEFGNILKGLLSIAYIKARMFDYPTLFRNKDVRYKGFITDISYNNVDILYKQLNYKSIDVNNVHMSKYRTFDVKQPIINISQYDFLLRDVSSYYGLYCLLNPFNNLMSASWRCIKEDVSPLDESFATSHYIRDNKYYYYDDRIEHKNIIFKEGWLENVISRFIGASSKQTIPDIYSFTILATNDAYKLAEINDDDESYMRTMNPLYDADIRTVYDKFNIPYSRLCDDSDFNNEDNIIKNIGSEYFMNVYKGTTPLEDTYKLKSLKIINIFNELSQYDFKSDNSPIKVGNEIIRDIFYGVQDNLTTTVNTGFSDKLFENLSGGDLVGYNGSEYNGILYIKSFIDNPTEPFSGSTPIETYNNIYKSVINKTYGGKNAGVGKNKMFANVFKFTDIQDMSCEYMFALIINYFHKHTVSFNSIYNQVLFPGIVYNSSIFMTAANKYSEIFGTEINNVNNFTKFVRNYLKSIKEFNTSTDKDNYFNKVAKKENRDITKRETNMSYEHLAEICSNKENMLSLELMPSINNKFLSILFAKGLIGDEDTNKIFSSSSLLSSFKRADSVETFIFVILLINKYMSYYNIDIDADISYTGQVSQEPFGYKLDI